MNFLVDFYIYLLNKLKREIITLYRKITEEISEHLIKSR